MISCKECHENFEPTSPLQKYCSVRCRLRFSSRASAQRLRDKGVCLRCSGLKEDKRVHCSSCRDIINELHRTNPKYRENQKAWLRSHPEFNRGARLRQKYGISSLDYELMHDIQQGACLICGQVMRLVVDHSHETGEVRGLLCILCNAGLGMFKDSAQLLSQAQRYLSSRE